MVSTRAVNVARQLSAIKAVVPDAGGTIRKGALTCILRLQPTPASQTYTVRLAYRQGERPRVTVTDPLLVIRPGAKSLPHVYPGNELCLCLPGEWKPDMLLAQTIVPWTAEWLLHYELWQVTGKWNGGGHTYVVADEHSS